MKHLTAVPAPDDQPSVAQLSYARSLGIKPDGHTGATMHAAIAAAKKAQANAVKNPPIRRESASPFDTSSREHSIWREISSTWKYHEGRGGVEWRVAQTVHICDPFAEWEHCYPSQLKEAIVRLVGAGFDLRGAVDALQQAEDQRSGFDEYLKRQAIASRKNEGGAAAA